MVGMGAVIDATGNGRYDELKKPTKTAAAKRIKTPRSKLTT